MQVTINLNKTGRAALMAACLILLSLVSANIPPDTNIKLIHLWLILISFGSLIGGIACTAYAITSFINED